MRRRDAGAVHTLHELLQISLIHVVVVVQVGVDTARIVLRDVLGTQTELQAGEVLQIDVTVLVKVDGDDR